MYKQTMEPRSVQNSRGGERQTDQISDIT